ncbi:hypothetical protein PQX77_018988 [Marasmius sp. AFHP31]|nr:hypothetical protein PQX77_018988 [Marasmius sp. AFHP31]
MSSDNRTGRKRTRSSGKSNSPRACKPSRSSKSDEPQSPPENLTLSAADEPRREGTPESVGPPGLGTKPLDVTEVQETNATPLVPNSSSVKEGFLPHALDKDKDRDKSNSGLGAEEQAPLDGTKTDNPAGNGDTAKEGPRPTIDKSWDIVMTEVTALDEGFVGGWKDDIDTLLVFAGLFSAVVTAFTIESYQWLQEAPEDTTVALLKQISQQLNGGSVAGPDEFAISPSVVAINVLWFLSLIIALVDALFALLCKQWLREHRRHTHTRTPSEALALRWLRQQSLEKWHVSTILASLPMLLEFALFLFLAGLLELLRTRHPVPFALAMIVVSFAALFYLGTTIIPAVDIIRQATQVTWKLREMRTHTPFPKRFSPADFIMELPPMELICPYKSPQAWVAIQSLTFISRILLDRDHTVRATISSLSDWSSVDLELLQRSSINLAPPFYELDAFRWLVAELRDSPHMIPHLRNILSTIPLHLIMPAVFDQWFSLPERKWAVSDIEAALDPNLPSRGIEDHLTYPKSDFLYHGREMGYFNHFLHWVHVSMNGGNGNGRSSSTFLKPFGSIDAIPDDYLRFRLWRIYTEIVRSPATSAYCWATVMEDLAPYIIASSPDYALHIPTATTASSFVKSAAGFEFLYKMHNTILERTVHDIYNIAGWEGTLNWTEAIDIVRRVHELPEDYFRVIPGNFSLSLSKLRRTLKSLSPTDTEIDFGYLDSFTRGWGSAARRLEVELVEILSEHINEYPQSNAESSHCPDTLKTSPLVMSSAGFKLITFVNDRLAEEQMTWGDLEHDGRASWRDAIERVRLARPELPPDHFKHIFHEGHDDPPAPHEHPSQQEEQAEDPDDTLRDVTNTGGVARNVSELGGRSSSSAGPSPKPEPGELDERDALVENANSTSDHGSIPRQPVATGNLASDSAGSPVQGTMVGGSDADKEV